MNKILLLMLSLVTLNASAQKDELPDGMLAVELQANPFSNDFNTFKMTSSVAQQQARGAVRRRIGHGHQQRRYRLEL